MQISAKQLLCFFESSKFYYYLSSIPSCHKNRFDLSENRKSIELFIGIN